MPITTALNDTPSADELVLDLSPRDGSRPAPGGRGPATSSASRWLAALNLSRVLRWSGGCVLAAAGISFMFQGLYSFTPITRHWMLLGICALLGLMGAVTGIGLKETKGARSFLGFAAASFPVLASQLGAMVFSLWGHPPPGMPQPLVFSMLTATQVAGLTALTLAIITPLSHLGFMILARPQALHLTGLYTLANLSILLPVREGLLLGIIIAALGGGLYLADRHWARDFRLTNFEGRLSRGLMAVPLLVILGRSLFYPVGHACQAMLLAMIGGYLSFHWGRIVAHPIWKIMLQTAGNAALAAAWLTWILPAIDRAGLGEGAALYLIFLPLVLSVGSHAFISAGKLNAGYRHTAAGLAFLTVLYAHLLDGALLLSVIGAAVAVACLAVGVLAGARMVFLAGAASAVVSLGNLALTAFERHTSYAWIMLAGVGIVVLFSASLAEKGQGGAAPAQMAVQLGADAPLAISVFLVGRWIVPIQKWMGTKCHR